MGAPLAKASSDVLRRTTRRRHRCHQTSSVFLTKGTHNGVCAVCTTTQIDRVRFYTAKHSLLDKLRPRIAVRSASTFTGLRRGRVPNSAIADKLVLKMGIPRAKIGLLALSRRLVFCFVRGDGFSATTSRHGRRVNAIGARRDGSEPPRVDGVDAKNPHAIDATP